jgi:1-deoxy-D-xylulose 5-phosphate reductoisomerase
VLERHPDGSAWSRWRRTARAELSAQVERFRARWRCWWTKDARGERPARRRASVPAARRCSTRRRIPDADIVINAVVGAAGLEATLAALLAGKRLALANKESLVAGGPLVQRCAARGGGELVPVDSEHSAILQCLNGMRRAPWRA